MPAPKILIAGADFDFAHEAEIAPLYVDSFVRLGPLGPYPATYNDGAYRATIPAIDTARLEPGRTRWELWNRGSQGTLHPIARADIHIAASLQAGHDPRTYNEQVLAKLKAAMLRLAAEDEVTISIHNRTVTYQDPEKLQRMIDQYQAKVNAERNGGSVLTSIPVRLGRR